MDFLIQEDKQIYFVIGGESLESIIMDYTKENAASILCQAMFDETLRLRKCRRKKERGSIRAFLIESFRILTASMTYTQSQEKCSDDKAQQKQ